MNQSTCIHCSVASCSFNEENRCNAHEIRVGCNCCMEAITSVETQCISFKRKNSF